MIVVFTKKGKSGNNFIDNFEDTTEENSEVKYEESNELDTFSNKELNRPRENFKQFILLMKMNQNSFYIIFLYQKIIKMKNIL